MMTSFAENLLGYTTAAAATGGVGRRPNVLPAGWAGRKAGFPGCWAGCWRDAPSLCAGFFWDSGIQPDQFHCRQPGSRLRGAALGQRRVLAGTHPADLAGAGWAGWRQSRKLRSVTALAFILYGAAATGCPFPAGAGGAARDSCGGFWAGSGWWARRQVARHGTGCSLGLRRGAFSNEAGSGSAVMANACADTGAQGMWGILRGICGHDAGLHPDSAGAFGHWSGRSRCPPPASARAGQAFSQAFGDLGAGSSLRLPFCCSPTPPCWGWSHYGAGAAEYLLGRWRRAIPGAVCGNDSMGARDADGFGVESVRHL